MLATRPLIAVDFTSCTHATHTKDTGTDATQPYSECMNPLLSVQTFQCPLMLLMLPREQIPTTSRTRANKNLEIGRSLMGVYASSLTIAMLVHSPQPHASSLLTLASKEISPAPHTPPGTYAIATERRKIKYDLKGPGCAQRDILFLPIINTSAGGFVPQDPVTLPVHTEAAERYFGSKLAGALGRVGTRPRSVEEGLIRRWSRRVADVPGGGKGVFDATLSTDRAAGLLTAYTYRAIAHVALRATANAAAHAIARSNIATFF